MAILISRGVLSMHGNEWPQIWRLWLPSSSGISHQSKTEFSRAENSSAGAWSYPTYKVLAMALVMRKTVTKSAISVRVKLIKWAKYS